MFAARNGNVDAIKVLLDHKADVNAKEKLRGTTALMWAAEQVHPEAVKALVAAGADVGAATNHDTKGARAYLAPSVAARRIRRKARAAWGGWPRAAAWPGPGAAPAAAGGDQASRDRRGAAALRSCGAGRRDADVAGELVPPRRCRPAAEGEVDVQAADDAAAAAFLRTPDRYRWRRSYAAGVRGSAGLSRMRQGPVGRGRQRESSHALRLDRAAHGHPEPALQAGFLSARKGRESQHLQQRRLEPAVHRHRQPQYRRRRLSGAQAGHGSSGFHQGC